MKISWRNSDDDFEGDKYDENTCSDDDDEEFEGPRKRRRAQPKGPKGPKQKIVIPKNRPNFYGAVPGVQVGRIWETRMACCADGIQRPTVAGIHAGPEGAYSLSLSGGYEDDIDLGECFTYTGEGGRALKGTASDPKNLRTAPQSKDQTLTRGNLALSLNITTRKPVRVIRGSNLKNEFAPEYGYRYDGLYTVEKYWQCVGKSGFKVYKFALRRCPDQPPPPWVSGVVSYANAASSAEEDGEDMDDDDAEEQKPTVLKVKLFNK
ncbi:E3 ubiquitin-protein ligase UHRF1-like [Daphnia pulicaria]|uniref:E3 ubiquitin-protein ligase UHRF1-like n=1 Tax=Daphnia pulicaria TaxID=35523 RepID=UPI001EEAD1A6|nr:E3 ubiquitin-protein ligase UHRF1-like [Daphnia pulicaria]XP_046636354.1 E3 ubiquitin-protein ligase UHRF1-like [Daphnia pulicaria]XP_046636355.1 E3 ubiquitin-protein ligase UHRF1-like [Daphnia pulicaria]XP_046636356.1 E3 ubiquitin-protein ligase UHRF1-like [Daphnia pulicaria]